MVPCSPRFGLCSYSSFTQRPQYIVPKAQFATNFSDALLILQEVSEKSSARAKCATSRGASAWRALARVIFFRCLQAE
jgi:hypothetical protein